MTRIVKGRLLWFRDAPRHAGAAAHVYFERGALRIEAGKIVEAGEAREVLARAPADARIDDHAAKLILPGLIDAHIHYPQTRVVGSYGVRLLEWLQKYTFVEEQKFADPAHAEIVARFFLDELARQGTTTAMVYCTVHPQSAEAFFAEAERRNARMIAGKVMMDRNAPPALTDDPQRGYDDSKALLTRWHGRGRLGYAITPRFAITSSEAQLAAAGALAREFPDAHIQTHLSENGDEIALTKSLYPHARDYLDVYEMAGLLGPKSVFGHCLHLEAREIAALAHKGGVAAFCPTSNLFLGSGLFDEAGLDAAGVRVALATDIGGGTSYSLLQTANEAYKVLQMRRQSWPAMQAFYQMTLGNARALGLDDKIGGLEPGREADLVVLDARATPAMAHRMQAVDGDLAEELFVLMTMGEDRAVAQTYIAGEPAKR
ncbi:MAG: guanine deaminase [Pseudomonadota bacterium]|nr:guanine deaminase [Pseudomonadota bacterium]